MSESNKQSDRRTCQDKIKTLEEMTVLAESLRQQGEKIALAHGVFDLLHFGHVRHLDEARREGTVLVVSLTADAFVNKGPNRPVFPDHVRAEMVASLESVDWVVISQAASADPVLEAIRPDVYAKGKEYAVDEDDVTGKIVSERETVEGGGGRVVFTDGVTFSSSSLLNKHFNIYDPILQQHLDMLRQDNGLERLTGLIEKMQDFRILVIGDVIIDEYQYVSPLGKATKENIIATQHQKGETFAGGVVATANHLSSFCREVEVVTCFGSENSFEDLVSNSIKTNVKLTTIIKDDAPTTRKCRYIDHGYTMRKLFEVCYLDDSPMADSRQQELDRIIRDKAPDFDLVIMADFGHGLISASTIAAVTESARFLAVNTQTNSANFGFNLINKYGRADFICIDQPEARLAVADRFTDLPTIVSQHLPENIECGKIIVTAGKHGCYVYEGGGEANHVPGLTSTIVDTIGAGDAFFAVSAPAVAAGASISDAGFIGNAAGGLMVGIIGHRSSVDKASLIKFITAMLK